MRAPDPFNEVEQSIQNALKGDYWILMSRLANGSELSPVEREFLARLLLSMQYQKREGKKGKLIPEDLKFTIAFAYALMRALKPKRGYRDRLKDVAKLYGVGVRKVIEANTMHETSPELSPELISVIIDDCGGRREMRRAMDSDPNSIRMWADWVRLARQSSAAE